MRRVSLRFVVNFKHALKNSVIPVISYVGPLTAFLMTGTFAVEKLFSVPGLGRFFVDSVSNRDYPVYHGYDDLSWMHHGHDEPDSGLHLRHGRPQNQVAISEAAMKSKKETINNKSSLRLNPLSMHVNPNLFEHATDEEKQELVVIRQGTSLWKDAMRRFRKNKFAMVALVLIIMLFFFAFIGPLLTPYDYDQFNQGA